MQFSSEIDWPIVTIGLLACAFAITVGWTKLREYRKNAAKAYDDGSLDRKSVV